MRYIIALLVLIITSPAIGHEMTPTYPELRPSISDGLYSTKLSFFNGRRDVRFYEIEVFDKDWNRISFASQNKILNVDYLGRAQFEIYIRERDVKRISYICTTSKLLIDDVKHTGIASKICSKIKRDEK